MEPAEIHISSMVVHARPAALQSVKAAIARIRGAEIHGESAQGKLVVVVESDHQSQVTGVIETINAFDDVLNTALVYHQVEPVDDAGSDGS